MQELSNFLITICVIVGGVSCGYVLRRLGILHERYAPTISTVVLLVAYPFIAFLSIWSVSLEVKVIVLPCIQVISFFVILAVSLAISRLHHLAKLEQGTFVLAGALTNQGYTMGGLICFLLHGNDGLALAQIYVILWSPLILFVVFPLSNYFNPRQSDRSIGRVFLRGILHPRTLCGLGVAAGIVFSRLQVPYPGWIKTYNIVRILVIAGTFSSFSIIGLSLHFGHLQKYIRLYFTQGFIKFIIAPLLALLLIGLFGLKMNTPAGAVALTQGFMPTAVNAVLIANLFRLNARMASALFVVNTTVFLLVVLPILAFLVF